MSALLSMSVLLDASHTHATYVGMSDCSICDSGRCSGPEGAKGKKRTFARSHLVHFFGQKESSTTSTTSRAGLRRWAGCEERRDNV